MFPFAAGQDPSLGDVYANMDPVQFTGPSDWVTIIFILSYISFYNQSDFKIAADKKASFVISALCRNIYDFQATAILAHSYAALCIAQCAMHSCISFKIAKLLFWIQRLLCPYTLICSRGMEAFFLTQSQCETSMVYI